jgi:hypothetical protein
MLNTALIENVIAKIQQAREKLYLKSKIRIRAC